MRRNLTISFNEQFITSMDEARGRMSRGVWIEALTDAEGVAQAITLTKDLKAAMGQKTPTPKAERSPEPLVGLGVFGDVDIVGLRAQQQADNERRRLSKPPLQRPIVQKREK